MQPPKLLSRILALAFISLTTLATLTATACKKDQSATGAEAKKAMGLYAQGFNALLADPKRLITGYFSSLPAGKDPDLSRKPSLSSSSFVPSKLKEARDAFASAKDAAPTSLASLEAPAQRALTAMDKAVALYDEAYKHYEAEAYKDDGGAKAKQLHAQLTSARKELDDAMAKMGDALSSIEDVQAADELARFADDKDYGYWFRYYNQQAKLYLTQVERAEAPADLAKLPAAAKTLAAASADLVKFTAGKGAKLHTSFRNYAERATTFDAEVAKLTRLIAAGKTFRDRELGDTYDALISAYNGLINTGNALYQVEGVHALKDE